MVCYGTFTPVLAKCFEVSDLDTTILQMVYTTVLLPLNPLVNWTIDRKGIRVAGFLASTLLLIGTWLRNMAGISEGNGFWILVVAQTLGGSGQAFVLSIPSKLSMTWFPKKELAKATMMITLANPIGCIFGMALPPFFISNYSESEIELPENVVKARGEIAHYLFIQSFILTVLLVPMYFLA